MRNSMQKSLISATVSAALILSSLPRQAWAVAGVSDRPIPISSLLSLSDLAPGSPLREQMEGFENAMEALAQRNISELDRQGILDPFHLTQQEIRLFKKGKVVGIYSMSDPSKSFLPPRTDQLNLVVKEGALVLQGFSSGELVAERWFKGPSYEAIVHNKKIAVASTHQGDFYVLDYGSILRNQFLGAITPFKALSNQTTTGPHKFHMRFISSGEVPVALAELENLDPERKVSHIARDGEGRPLLQAGDLIVSEWINGKLRYRFTLGLKPLLDQVARGSVFLGALAFVSNHEGYQTTLSEEFNRLLQVGNENQKGIPKLKSSVEQALELLEGNGKDPEMEKVLKDVASLASNQLDPVKLLLKSIDLNEFKFILARPESMKRQKDMPVDQMTLLDWHARWEKIRNQALRENQDLNQKIEKIHEYRKGNPDSPLGASSLLTSARHMRTEVQLRDLEKRQRDLESQISSGNFLDNQVKLMKSSLLAENSFDEEMKPWREKIDWKCLKQMAIKTSSYAAAGAGALALGSWANADFAFAVSSSMNWAYQTFMPKIFLHSDQIAAQLGYDYTVPALWGFTKVMSWMLMTHFAGVLSVPLLKSGAILSSKMSPHFSKKAADLAFELEGISTWSRVVTLMMRPYAYLFLPFWHYVNKVTGQNILEAWRAGLGNPLARYNGDSTFGKKLGLNPGEKVSVGVMNPFKSSPEREQQKEQMLKLRTNLQYQKRQSFRLASVLVNIVLAKEMGLDPSTLLLLQNGLMDLDTLKKFQSDPQIRSQWKRGVFAVQQEIWQMLKEKDDFRLDQIDSEGFLDLLKDAQINVQKVNQSGISRRLLEDITRESSLVARQFLAGVANFGRSDHLFLKGLIASPFVGRQTAQEAISDHAILVGMNSFYTLRADPEHIEKLAYSESGAPMHYFNVTMNTIVHLLMAGPRRALVYQSIKEGVETNYLPIQSTLLSVAAKPEQFFRGFMHWTTELIKLPRSNVGSYYVKEAIKQVTTAQAGLILALIGRSYVGEMPLGTALNTTLFYWVASMIGFAWPWALVSRGNNMEEARLARESRRHRLAIENLGKALQQKNESEIQKQTAELVEMTSSEAVVKAFGKISPPILQFMETYKLQEFVRQAARNPAHRRALLVAWIELDHAEKSSVPHTLRRATEKLEAALYSGDFSSYENVDPNELGRKLGDLLTTEHSVANRPNSALSAALVFVFGAALSIYLASELMDKSFHETITIGSIGQWSLYYLAFLSTVYVLGSKFMWEKAYLPSIDKLRARLSIKKSIPSLTTTTNSKERSPELNKSLEKTRIQLCRDFKM